MNSVSHVSLQKVNLGILFSVLLFCIGTMTIGMLLSGKVYMHVIVVVPGCYSGDRTHKKVGYTTKGGVLWETGNVLLTSGPPSLSCRTTWRGLTETTQQCLKTRFSLSVSFYLLLCPTTALGADLVDAGNATNKLTCLTVSFPCFNKLT